MIDFKPDDVVEFWFHDERCVIKLIAPIDDDLNSSWQFRAINPTSHEHYSVTCGNYLISFDYLQDTSTRLLERKPKRTRLQRILETING